ncbi:ATP-dependent RNA helicase DbpA [Ferrimonas senticii]|uniref:ATP-dependent RNA helicase DbpA n=1 Tax=Ferrimonas senticii TaxID=394566 RepID=UPI0003FD1D43|nr:ATP-dependent RNA helicase DbpA [Ferrimonas senticii]
MTAFNTLPLSPAMLANLEQLGFASMTPIQAEALPLILQGDDLIAKAKTGSGKTVAFGLGLLHKLEPKQFALQSMILCPTRELADQVASELRRLARAMGNIKILTLCGGLPMGPQIGSLEHGAHIIVGTPGRILQHIKAGRLDFSALTTLVFDEADRMLDMGFEADINAIKERLPHQRQTLLFSATYPEQIEKLASRVQRNPKMIEIAGSEVQAQITQRLIEVEGHDKTELVKALLNKYQPESTVIFCNTRIACQQLADDLEDAGVSVVSLHGDKDQRDRDQMLVRFANKSVSVLVATDVAARGLDIKELAMVINFEVAFETEVHVHRVGRTGRAGSEGMAMTLASGNEMRRVADIEELQGYEFERLAANSLPKVAYLHLDAPMVTLSIGAGRKSKMRPGDILGALTASKEIAGKSIGKISVADRLSYVAVERKVANKALKILQNDKIKGRKLIVRMHK